MKRSLFLLLVLVIAGLTNANAQMEGNYQYNTQRQLQNSDRNPASNAVISNDTEVVLETNGLMNIVADNYVAMFNLIQVGESIDSVDMIMNKRIARFKNELQKAGIDTGEIKVDMISFVPKYDLQTDSKIFSKTYNEVPAGYELQKNVTIRFRNSSKIDHIVSAAAKCEIYDLVKVDYFIPNLQKSLDSLRTVCLQQSKTKAKAFETVGIKLDTNKKVVAENFTTVYPQTRYFSYQAFSRPSLNAAKKKVSSSNYVEAQKNTSKFYSQVDYDHYDLVINPVITEPVVQISYSVTVKYILFDKTKEKNIYYILTPTGDVKQFNPK